MTPPEHLVIGLACGNLAYSCFQLSSNIREDRYHRITYTKTLIVMALSAIMPDIDSFFGHYTSNDPWVGHRGMTHSFLGISVLGIGLVLITSFLSMVFRIITGYWRFLYNYFLKKENIDTDFKVRRFILYPFYPKVLFLYFIIAFFGGLSHLISDLFQPPSVWGGLPLLFPLKVNGVYHRIGGFTTMGWYELKVFWIVIGSFAITTPIIIIVKFLKRFRVKILNVISITIFVLVITFQAIIFGWCGKIVTSGKYKDDMDWYKQQMQMVEKELPTPISNFTKKAAKIFAAVFKATQRM